MAELAARTRRLHQGCRHRGLKLDSSVAKFATKKTYDPYGGHATATALNGALPANPWRYAGGALDATGLYHFGARYYDPALGRWTQQDSVVSLGDPANANRYAYAGDDPVNFLDPGGTNFVSDYLTGADSEKRAKNPKYHNPLSSAEDSAARGVRTAGNAAANSACLAAPAVRDYGPAIGSGAGFVVGSFAGAPYLGAAAGAVAGAGAQLPAGAISAYCATR